MNKKFALVIVDLQKDFLPPNGALAVSEAESIIPGICELVNINKYKWSTIIATQDWHPPDHTSFASQHNVPPLTELTFEHPLGEKEEATGEVKTLKQTVWPDHCIQGTQGSELDTQFSEAFDKIDVTIPKHIIHKGYLKDREYYSCFKDSWKLDHTEMEHTLKSHNITDVVFVGLAYDFCVMNSAIDCVNLDLNLNTYVIKSYSKSVFPENDSKTDEIYQKNGVKILQDISQLNI